MNHNILKQVIFEQIEIKKMLRLLNVTMFLKRT